MSSSSNSGNSYNDKKRFAGAVKVGTFSQQDLVAAIKDLGVAPSEELLAEIAADFADRQNNPKRPRLSTLKAMPSPRHHDHCHRAWVCDDDGNCDWEWICE